MGQNPIVKEYSETELAWAAGFFDGEGNTGFNGEARPSSPQRSRSYKTVRLQISQVNRESLDRFCAAVGVGTVYGPYGPYSNNKQPYYSFSCAGVDAIAAFEKLSPYLCLEKTKQALAAIAGYKEQTSRPRLGGGQERKKELAKLRSAL